MHRIGLLGGTFDPVHRGHIQLAARIRLEFLMDRVVFIPAAQPPHKNCKTVSDIAHRLAMLRLAVAGQEGCFVSEIEVSRTWPSYTVDTLRQLRKQNTADRSYYFIIGYDAFLEIESWHSWREVLSSAHFIVALRPGYDAAAVEELLVRIGLRPRYADKKQWYGGGGHVIQLFDQEIEDISSTDIRRRIGAGKDWMHLVPEGVGNYILRHHLYS